MDTFGNDYYKSLQDTASQYGTTDFKEYAKAGRSIMEERLARRKEMARSNPFQQRRLAGMLGARGLGSSYVAGGAGTEQANTLLNQQAQEFSGVDTAAQQQLGELGREYKKSAYERDARKAKLSDYLGAGVSIATSFL
jgi:hypothetical protein